MFPVSAVDTDWERCIDPLSKNNLWLNKREKTRQWKKPTALDSASSAEYWDAPVSAPPSIHVLLPNSPVPRASTPSAAPGSGGSGATPDVSLPPHWIKVSDSPAITYFFNTRTGATSWRPPANGEEIPPDDTTSLWIPHVDESSGSTYYTHKDTGESSWIKPMPGDLYDWEECVDPDSGSSYYFSPARNQTVWEKPPPLIPHPPSTGTAPSPASAAPVVSSPISDLVSKPMARASVSRRLSTQPTRKQRLSSVVPTTKQQKELISKLLRLDEESEDMVESISPPDMTVPDEWDELEDLSTGRPVFINRHRGISTWVRPNELLRKFNFAPAPTISFGGNRKTSVMLHSMHHPRGLPASSGGDGGGSAPVVSTAPAFMSASGAGPSQQEVWERGRNLKNCEGTLAKRGGGLSLFGKKGWKVGVPDACSLCVHVMKSFCGVCRACRAATLFFAMAPWRIIKINR